MRRLFVLAAAFALAAAGSARSVDFGFGLQVNDEGRKSFYLAVSSHYQVPEKEIIVVREKKIPDEEMPVVFYLASRTGVLPQAIIDLRLGGKTWMDITVHLGRTAEVYYVEVGDVSGPPYGNAYGHFKKRSKDKWGEIRLADSDIINLVNLRFISEHYGWSATEVIRMRQGGQGFVDINRNVKEKKAGKGKQANAGTDEKPGKGKGKKK